MRRVLCAVAALFIAVSLAPMARADATADARKAIQAAYSKANAAAAKKDVEGTFAILSPDAVLIGPKGQKASPASLRQQFTQLFAVAQSIKDTTTIEKFALKGKEANATTREHTEIVLTNPQNHQTTKIVVDGSSQDTWVKTA